MQPIVSPPTSDNHPAWISGHALRVGVGVYDGLSALAARIVEPDFLWLSSFSVAASLGRPDSGLIDATEMATLLRTVCASSPAPVVVDMDSGYGDPAKVALATELMSLSGAAAVCIEDNPLVKRSSLYRIEERILASPEEHCDRLAAARSAVRGSCQIIARTEALVADLGVGEALRRAAAYVDIGADAVFIQAVKRDGGTELLEFCREWQKRTPVFIAPTRYPKLAAKEYLEAGVTHWIFANHAIRAAYRAVDETFHHVARLRNGASTDIDADIASVAEIADLLGARAVGDGQ